MIPRRNRSWIKRSRFGAALFSLVRATCESGASASGFWGTVFFAVDCLATVFPHNNCTKHYVQTAETCGHKPVGERGRREQRKGAESHQTDAHNRHYFDGVHAAGDHARSVK